jgi:hypothetical protein
VIIPTLWIKRQGPATHDIYGQPRLSTPTREKVAPVKLEFSVQHTSVRTDSTGSHGHAYEGTADVILLAQPTSKIAVDDILTVLDGTVRVTMVRPQYRVNGILDHYEIRCDVWR